MRALIVVRLSRLTDATTSPERQEEVCRSLCAQRGWSVVDVARDLNVSAGATSPFDRPELRPWLAERADEYDAIVFYRTDRLVRRITHMSRMIEWSQEHGKNLVSATEPFDLSTSMGEAMATLIAMFGQMELEAISERNAGAAQHNIAEGKYRGGLTPAGYRAEKDDAGDWRLVIDEDGLAPVLRDVVGRIIGGERVSAVVRSLNTEGVQTHKDRQAELNGKTSAGREWSFGSLRRVLTSPSLIGQATTRPAETDASGKPKTDGRGRKVYGPEQVIFRDGEPMQRAEPIVSPADYRRLQAVLAETSEQYAPKTRATAESSLLTQVLFCRCGQPMYRVNGHKGRARRYRCVSAVKQGSCGAGSVTMAEAEEYATTALFSILGNLPAVRREYRAGTDNTATIADIDAQLESLSAAVTRFPAGAGLDNLLTQVDTLTAKRDELAEQPTTESGWVYTPTGETFGELWDSFDSNGRNDFLRQHGIRITVDKSTGKDADYSIDPGNVPAMVEAVSPGHYAETANKLRAVGWDADNPLLVLASLDRQSD